MDNRIFNVNGTGLLKLTKTLELAFGIDKSIVGYRVNEKGIILYSYDTSSKQKPMVRFLTPHTIEQAAKVAWDWLLSGEAKKISCEGWDANADHDGSNERGFRVYTEDWGMVDGDHDTYIIIPAYCWYGK